METALVFNTTAKEILKIYAFPGWIGNLGVVPLFLLRIFLSFPRDLSFFARLIDVAHVRDTIFILLQQHFTGLNKQTRSAFLQILSKFVKANHAFLLIFSLLSGALLAKEVYLRSEEKTFPPSRPQEQILISIGEHAQIDVGTAIATYTVGNPQIISYRLDNTKKSILIKGKKLGFTEILIWDHQNNQRKYSIYSLSKKNYLGLLDLAQQLRQQNLAIDLVGTSITITGEIRSKDVFAKILQLKSEQENKIWIQAKLTKTTESEIIGEIYGQFYLQNIDQVQCHWQDLEIFCYYPKNQEPSKETKNYFEKKYRVIFATSNNNLKTTNFKLRFKIIQIEELNGHEIQFGLHQFQGSLGELFTLGLEGILRKNQFNFNTTNLAFKTLASPEVITHLDTPTSIEIGSEIPYQVKAMMIDNSSSAIQWKFAGLKVDLNLLEAGEHYELQYTTQLTRGEENKNVSGNKSTSVATLKKGEAVELFQVELKTSGQEKKGIPVLTQIPILGSLFQSSTGNDTFKKISGVVLLE